MQIFAPAVRDESVEREWGRESFPPSKGVFCVQNDVYQITLLEIDGSVFRFFGPKGGIVSTFPSTQCESVSNVLTSLPNGLSHFGKWGGEKRQE